MEEINTCVVDLVREHGSKWVVEKLIDVVGPKLPLWHIANAVKTQPETAVASEELLGIIERSDESCHWSNSLDFTLMELDTSEFRREPKPTLVDALRLDFGEPTKSVLEVLRAQGHRVKESSVLLRHDSHDQEFMWDDIVLTSLEEHIVNVARQLCVDDSTIESGMRRSSSGIRTYASRCCCTETAP